MGKKTGSRKRFLLTDINGLLLAVMVVSASVQDRARATTLLGMVLTFSCRLVLADQGFAGQLVDWAQDVLGVVVHIIGKTAGQKSFQVRPRR